MCCSLPSSPNARLHLTQQKHSGCQFLSRAVTIFYKQEGEARWLRVDSGIIQAFHTKQARWRNDRRFSHSEWACCSGHSGGRRGWSSPTRSTAVRPFQRSCDSLTLSHIRCRQSARGATPFRERLPPAPGDEAVFHWPGSLRFLLMFGRGFAISHLSYHWFLAGWTVALGGCLDSLSAQVRLEQPQHAVQRASRRRLRWNGGLLRGCHHRTDRYRWLGQDQTRLTNYASNRLTNQNLSKSVTKEKKSWVDGGNAQSWSCLCGSYCALDPEVWQRRHQFVQFQGGWCGWWLSSARTQKTH